MANRSTNILISEGLSGIAYVDRRGVGAEIGAGARFQAEAGRLADIKTGATPPAECGLDIAPAPARGGFVLQRIRHMEGMTREDFVDTACGYVRRSPIRRSDVFDGMEAAALRRKQPCPLTPGQIAIGRRYHDLVELLTADGTKMSSLQGSMGGPDGRDWMDRRLAVSAEVEGMRKRIGLGVAMSVRRVRPSARGGDQRGAITDRALVDEVCLQGKALADVLRSQGWQVDGRNRKAVSDALSAALDRMIGYRGEKSS